MLKKGYGNALIEGIKKAKGKYVIMADADNSYDFNKINNFYSKLKSGFDIVQGCRFSYGGGEIKKKMPISHQYLGNPVISFLSKLFSHYLSMMFIVVIEVLIELNF